MGAVVDVFGGDGNALMNCTLDIMADSAALQEIRTNLTQDNITIDGKPFAGSNFCVASRVGSLKTGKDVPSAIARIEYTDNLPVSHPVVLQPVYRTHGIVEDFAGRKMSAVLVPNAPDIADRPITEADAIRTLRVLKAAGLSDNVGDMKAADQYAFLKDANGDLICYPSSTDPEFAGHPIAFVRDINSVPANLAAAKDMQLMGNINKTFCELSGKPVEEFMPAPQECVEACAQQIPVLQKLQRDLKEAGINVNSPIVAGPHSAKAGQPRTGWAVGS